jgi:glycosyltransferase involved in cell wall biosynthesis
VPGGVNEVVISLAQQLRTRSSYDPVIAVATWDESPQPPETRGINVVNLRIRQPAAVGGSLRMVVGFLATLPVDLWRLAAFIRKRRVEVVNVHFPDLNAGAFLLLKALGVFHGKLLLSFHGADMTAIGNTRGFYRMVWQRLITRVDGVVACSEALREDVLRFAPRARVIAIHNGADVALFDQPRTDRRKRRRILHIGKFEHKKSQDILLRAFQFLLQSIPDASLVLIGTKGPQLEAVRALIAECGLGGRVELYVDLAHEQLPAFMERSDLFVLPSRAEGCPIVLLEAGAAGLPVVATPVGGIREMIEDGRTGVLVPPDNALELERAMRGLLTDLGEADRLARAWHDTVVAGWGWDRTCERYVAFVEQLS